MPQHRGASHPWSDAARLLGGCFIIASLPPNTPNAYQLLRPCQALQAHGPAKIVRTSIPQAITTTPTTPITAKNS